MPGALVLLTGRSFSGKSTFAQALARSLPAAIVSYDAINAERGLHGGRGVAVEDWMRTDDVAHERAAELLAAGATVVVDDTSSPRFLRDAWRDLARRSSVGFVLVFIDVRPEIVLDRLRTNRSEPTRHDVLDDVMTEHLQAFEPPETDEHHLRLDGTIDADAHAVVDLVRTSLSSPPLS